MTWATDAIFVAGGDLVMEGWRDFQAQTGVSAIVAIAAAAPGLFTDPLPWAWLWLPLADEGAYTLEHLGLGADFIDHALRAGRKVLLHGPQGRHRARPLLAAHLLASGKSLARVLREIEQRPWLAPYKGDPELLRQFAETRAGG
jgi:hypothetical protein